MAYIDFHDLEIYKLARELSHEGWKIYENMVWNHKKIIGDQAITAIDSVGANIVEGYGRFHYLDRIKFLYNARASLFESLHWLELMLERKIIERNTFELCKKVIANLIPKLNKFIQANYRQREINSTAKHVSVKPYFTPQAPVSR